MIFEQFVAVIRAFEREGVEYVLVGGVAVNVHGIVRTTEDVDFFVRPTPENVARHPRGARPPSGRTHTSRRSGPKTWHGAYPTVRYGPPEGDILIDLLAGLGTAFRFEDLESERRRFGDVTVTVATPAMLWKMKRGTMRPRDQADAVLLRERFQLSDDEV